MGFTFVKLSTGEIVASSGGLVFRKLSTQAMPDPENGQIDLSALGLSEGTYTITVVAKAIGLNKSEHSEEIIYTNS